MIQIDVDAAVGCSHQVGLCSAQVVVHVLHPEEQAIQLLKYNPFLCLPHQRTAVVLLVAIRLAVSVDEMGLTPEHLKVEKQVFQINIHELDVVLLQKGAAVKFRPYVWHFELVLSFYPVPLIQDFSLQRHICKFPIHPIRIEIVVLKRHHIYLRGTIVVNQISVTVVHQIIIAVHKGNPLTLGYLHARVPCDTQSQILRRDDLEHTGVLLFILRKDGTAIVGRPVVHTNDLPFPHIHALAQEGVEAAGKELLHVIDGNNDG